MVQSESDGLLLTVAELMEIARKKAFEEGREIGLKNIALSMLQKGLEVEYIAKITKLTVAEVNQLKGA